MTSYFFHIFKNFFITILFTDHMLGCCRLAAAPVICDDVVTKVAEFDTTRHGEVLAAPNDSTLLCDVATKSQKRIWWFLHSGSFSSYSP
jgi:hypothetical protein